MTIRPVKTALLLACVTPLLVSCGDKKEYTGQFIDSPVEGLRYRTDSQDGVTNEDGEFTYRRGETVHFYIGNYSIGSSHVHSKVTPLDLADTDLYTNYRVINTARLLQTLDSNSGKAGIQISEEARNESGRLDGVDLDAEPTAFASDPRLVDFLGAVTTGTTLKDADEAIADLKRGVNSSDDSANDFTVTASVRTSVYTGSTAKIVSLSGSVESGITDIESYTWSFDKISPSGALDETVLKLNDLDTLNDATLTVPPYSSQLGEDVEVTLKLLVKTTDGKQGWAKTTITVCGAPGC